MPSNRVVIPPFDPAIDSLTIECDGDEFVFVVDMALFHAISNGEFNMSEANVDPEQIYRLLLAGCQARHPDLAIETVRGWFRSARAIQGIRQGLEEYMTTVQSQTEGADGAGEASAGPNSGRGRTTTSGSRRRK